MALETTGQVMGAVRGGWIMMKNRETTLSQMLWHSPAIPSFERRRQKDQELRPASVT